MLGRGLWAALALAAGLLLSELLARGVLGAFGRVPLVVSDPRAGWAGRPDLDRVYKYFSGARFEVSTDAHGRRRPAPAGTRAPAAGPPIVLVGDSFVYGVGVSDAETFAVHLQRRFERPIFNLGVPSWGTDQELVGLEAFCGGPPGCAAADIVVLLFQNDLEDVQRDYDPYLGRSKPRFAVADGSLARGHYRLSLSDRLADRSRLFWLLNSQRSLWFAAPPPPAAAGAPLVLASLRAMRELARERGARLHLLAHRSLGDHRPVALPLWERLLGEAGAVDITARIAAGLERPVGPDGGHWSAEAHRRVASLVARSLRDEPLAP